MNRTPLSVPEIAIIAGTRAAFGAGVGLLLADRLNEDQRKAVGWALLGIGAITTIPIVAQILNSRHEPSAIRHAHGRDPGNQRSTARLDRGRRQKPSLRE